jgi:hypothetical protein
MEGGRPLEVVHLGFLARRVFHDVGHLGMFGLEAAHQALDRGVAVAEAVLLPQILPDALGAESFGQGGLDNLPVRLGGALGAGGRVGRF